MLHFLHSYFSIPSSKFLMYSHGSTLISLKFYQEKQNAKFLSSGPTGITYVIME